MHIRCVLIRTANRSDSDKLLKMIQEYRSYQYCTYIHVLVLYQVCAHQTRPVPAGFESRCCEILSVQKPNFFFIAYFSSFDLPPIQCHHHHQHPPTPTHHGIPDLQHPRNLPSQQKDSRKTI